MQEVFLEILSNLKLVGFGIGLFILAYICNMLFSIYYNISLLKEKFQGKKILDSVIKILVFGLGTATLSISITLIPMFAEYCGIVLPEVYVEVFQSLAIVIVFLITACKYVVESFNKFKLILDYHSEDSVEG